jgi:hypothetical protein
MISNPKKKGDNRYKGPFEIVEVCDNNIYEIKSEINLFHALANFFKRFSLKKDGRLYHEEINEVAEANKVSKELKLMKVVEKAKLVCNSRSRPVTQSIKKSTRAVKPTQRLIAQ